MAKAFVVLTGLCALMALCALVSVNNSGPVSLENGEDERAKENSFFDALAAKDKVLVKKPMVLKGKKGPWTKGVKHMAKEGKSMKMQFKQAQQQLAQEQSKMHMLDEDDRVHAEEQKTAMERMKAEKQAREYEKHLDKLNDSVFPVTKSDRAARMLDATFSIRHALTDNIPKERYHAHHYPVKVAAAIAAKRKAEEDKKAAAISAQKKHAAHKKMMAAHPAHQKYASLIGNKPPASLSSQFQQYRDAITVTKQAILDTGADKKGNKPAAHKTQNGH